jgi:hypothetical protein
MRGKMIVDDSAETKAGWTFKEKMSETQIDAVMEAPSMKERLAAKKAAARIVGKPDVFEAAASGDLELVEDHVLADAGCIHKTDDRHDSFLRACASPAHVFHLVQPIISQWKYCADVLYSE